jgi:nitrogen fixation NifU-like protein
VKEMSAKNMDRLDEFLDNLQEKIFDDARRAYGEKGFQRWRNPLYRGRMENCDAHARIKGKCGDTMEIYLKFGNNRIRHASYFTDGCASSGLCGSFAAELAIGKDPDELIEITGGSVLEAIGRLPEEDRHCADLAAETLQAAVANYMAGQKN